MISIQDAHVAARKYLELIQDLIVLGLCAMLFAAMGIKLFHLGQRMLTGTDFSLVIGDILFLLVLLELFRLLLIYLEEHREHSARSDPAGRSARRMAAVAGGLRLHSDFRNRSTVLRDPMAKRA
jgi:hypothetical protein